VRNINLVAASLIAITIAPKIKEHLGYRNIGPSIQQLPGCKLQ